MAVRSTVVGTSRGRWAEGVHFAAPGALSLFLILALWEAVSRLVGSNVLPGVIDTLHAVQDLAAQRAFWSDLAVTAWRIAGSFVIALVFSVAVGVLLGVSPMAARIFGPWVNLSASVPSLLVIIVVYLLVGINNVAAMVGTAVVVAPSMTQAVWDGMRAINPELQEMARSFNVPSYAIVRRVLVPQTLPHVFTAARNGLALTWRIMIFVELVGQSTGVGYRIQYFYNTADMTRVLGTALPFVGIMLAVEMMGLRPLERRVFRWRRNALQ